MPDTVAFTDIYVDDAMLDRASEVLRSGRFVKGPVVEEFEAAFADACDAEHAVGVSSGTDALYLAMQAAGIGDGDAVLVPGHTFFATVSPILELGARPVFVDVDPLTYTLDVGDLARTAKHTPAATAVVPVHLYGHPAEMHAIGRIADRYDMTVVEDACQAHGATYDGDPVGSFGDVGCFSFYPSKNMTVGGDGGMLVTDDEALAHRAGQLRNHGRNEDGEHVRLGLNHRLDEVSAAVGLEQLSHLADWNAARAAAAETYRDHLRDVEAVRLPREVGDVGHVYHLFVVQAADRDALRAHLDEAGIATGIHYETPVHRTPAVAKRLDDVPSVPRTERLVDRILSLPMHPRITDEEIAHVGDEIAAFYEGR